MRTDLDGRLPIVYNGRTAEEWYTLYCQEAAKHQIKPTDEIEGDWLRSIGFMTDATSDIYRIKNWLVLKCDARKWQAYSVKSSHWHYLCDVDRREDVTNLINALKLNAYE